jgi:hypothetical protein
MRMIYHQGEDRFRQEAASDLSDGRFDVDFASLALGADGQTKAGFEICSRDPGRLMLENAHHLVELDFESRDELDTFVAQRMATLADIVAACVGGGEEEAFLWVGHDEPSLWFICVRHGEGVWRGCAVRRKQLDAWQEGSICRRRIENYLLEPTEQSAEKLLGLLVDAHHGLGLPGDFPVLIASPPDEALYCRLTVKLEPDAEWLLLFPIDRLMRADARRAPAASAEIEWIVTSKSLVRNAAQRREMLRDLSDLRIVLGKTVIILNDYKGFDESCLEATALVCELLDMLSSVDVQTNQSVETLGLRRLLNAGAEQIEQALRDPNTWYAFGEFHVVNGCWQLGHDAGAFPMDRFGEGELQHIKLLRIYHCNSVYDIDRSQLPRESITARLLRAGANRVEGSTLPEYHLTFIAHLLRLLCSPSGLRSILFAQSFEHGKDVHRLLKRLESLVGTLDA